MNWWLSVLVAGTLCVPPMMVSGQARKIAPDCIGLEQRTASRLLSGLRIPFSVRESETLRPEQDRIVIAQTIAPFESFRFEALILTISVFRGHAVPELIGLTWTDARRRLEQAGVPWLPVFKVVPGGRDGTVVAQSPNAGERLAQKGQVRVNIAVRTLEIAAPAFTRLPLSQAVALADRERLTLTVRWTDIDQAAQAGLVLRQEPAAGQRHNLNQPVTVEIGRLTVGQPVTLPAWDGRDVVEATAFLRAHGISFTERIVAVSLADQDGRVINSRPPAGTRMEGSERVELVIGRLPGGEGGALATVPDLRGKPLAAAVAELTALKLSAEAQGVAGGDAGQLGLVRGTNPPAGRRLTTGTKVEVWYWRAGEQFVMPDCVERPLTEAQAMLAGARIKVVVRPLQVRDERPDGTVIAQSILGGVRLRTAPSEVVLFVKQGAALPVTR